MPNVYDDEKQKHHDDLGVHPEHREAELNDLENQFASPSAEEHTYDGDDDSRPDLRSEGALKDSSVANGRHLARQARDEAKRKSAAENAGIPNTDLRQAEQDGAILGKGYTGSGKDAGGAMGKLKSFRARLRNDQDFRKKVMLAGAGTGVIAAIVIVIIILFIIVSMFEIPGLVQNIVNFQFARMGRQFEQATTRETEEGLTVEAASDAGADSTAEDPGGVFGALKDKFGNVRDGLFEKIDGVLPGDTTINSLNSRLNTLLPSRVIGNLKDSHGLAFNYTNSKWTGRPVLTGMDLDGQTYELEQVSGIAKWTPFLKNIVQFKNQVKFSAQVIPALKNAMTDTEDGTGTNAVGFFVRGIVARQLRQEAGINLIAWNVAKFVGKNNQQARMEEETEKYDDIDDTTSEEDLATTSELDEAQTDAQAQQQQDIDNPTTEQTIINDGGVDQAAINAGDKDLSPNLATEAAGVGDPFFTLTVMGCIIYDGSVQQSGPTINNQTTQEQSAFYYVASAADQEKAGSQNDTVAQSYGLANAVDATDQDLGDTSTTNAYMRANGQTINTQGYVGSEAGSDGSYTYSILDALGITNPNSVSGKLINWIIDHGCHILTNTAVGIGIGLAGILSSILSFGGTEAGAEALGEGAGTFIKAYAQHVIDEMFVKGVLDDGVQRGLLQKITTVAYQRALPYIAKNGAIALGTAGLTILAHMITAARAGEFFSGLNQGQDLANEADAGGNFTSNQMEQTQLFGRPMLQSEVCESNQQDLQYIGQQQSTQTAFVRYFSPSNAESLLSKTADAVTGDISISGLNSFMSLSTILLRPLTGLNFFLNDLTSISSAAPCANANQTDYGQVQFGWSNDEESLIDSSPSYMPLENQKILDSAPGAEQQILQKYAVCFGYDFSTSGDGSFDPTDPNSDMKLDIYGNGSIGSLLANGNIQRDSSGNVLNQGLCSKADLSYDDTSDSFAADPDYHNSDPDLDSPQQNDLVFRTRLAMQYDSTIDEDIDASNITTD